VGENRSRRKLTCTRAAPPQARGLGTRPPTARPAASLGLRAARAAAPSAACGAAGAAQCAWGEGRVVVWRPATARAACIRGVGGVLRETHRAGDGGRHTVGDTVRDGEGDTQWRHGEGDTVETHSGETVRETNSGETVRETHSGDTVRDTHPRASRRRSRLRPPLGASAPSRKLTYELRAQG
jgi:hypothetical protein